MENNNPKIVYSTRDSFEAVATRMADEDMQELYRKKRKTVKNKSENYYWSNKYAISLVESIGGKKI